MACDLQRRNLLDGRGNLSEETLADFTVFFLEICLDQVNFMAELMQPAELYKRIIDWAKEEERVGGLMPNSTRVLAHILAHRELERKDDQATLLTGGRRTLQCACLVRLGARTLARRA
jgi:hypothetical protein